MIQTISIILTVFVIGSVLAELQDVFEWNEVSFVWPSEEAKDRLLQSGEYIPENNMPMGIAVWNDKMFVTVPRWKQGVAATLTYIPLNSKEKSPPLIPYPSLESNMLPINGNALRDDYIISTFRVQVDACDRLWVIDSGQFDFLNNTTQMFPPSIAIFDLMTDTLIRRYYLKDSDVRCDGSSLMPEIVVDVTKGKCDEAFAYLPDLGGYGLIVYSFKDNNSWRVTHNFFHLDPLEGDLTIGGVNVQWNDGIFGFALGAENSKGFRTAYFHPMISTNEFSVSTEVLRNQTLATSANNYHLFKHEGNRGQHTQASPEDFDEQTNVLFMNQLLKDGLACWNTKLKLNPFEFVLFEQDHEKLVFINDILIDKDRNLWVLSDKMTAFLDGRLNRNEINYRIMRTTVDDAIRGTPCDEHPHTNAIIFYD